jgi:PIN domain nuclease of toxin-antitoxin system
VRLLLDTHILFWWLAEQKRLSPAALSAVSAIENDVSVSIASAWEMSIKVGAGKWPAATNVMNSFEATLLAENFRLLPISFQHVRSAGLMHSSHRDPFDRLLAAQAMIEGLTLVTADAKLASLGAAVIW